MLILLLLCYYQHFYDFILIIKNNKYMHFLESQEIITIEINKHFCNYKK